MPQEAVRFGVVDRRKRFHGLLQLAEQISRVVSSHPGASELQRGALLYRAGRANHTQLQPPAFAVAGFIADGVRIDDRCTGYGPGLGKPARAGPRKSSNTGSS